MLKRGMAAKSIAVAMAISTATVKKHCTAIYRKLGVRGAAETISKTQPMAPGELAMLARGRLTKRETAVLVRVLAGASSKQIARSLDISVDTVRKHRENLMRKLDSHSTLQLATNVFLIAARDPP